MLMRHIVICGLPALQNFSTLSHKRQDFRGKFTEYKMCLLTFSTTFVWSISHSKKKGARYGQKCLVVYAYNTLYYCQILMKRECSGQFFEKSPNIKFHEYPSSGSWVVPYWQTGGWKDLTNLIVAFHNFAKGTYLSQTAHSPSKHKDKHGFIILQCKHTEL